MSHEREKKVTDLSTRQGLYKMRSPAWKDTYRNRCLERLRENRSKSLALRRRIYEQHHDLEADDDDEDDPVVASSEGGRGDNQGAFQNKLTIDQIMEQEWNHLTEHLQPSVSDGGTDTDGANYIDAMVSLYEEVCSELKREIHNDLKREEEHLLKMQKMWEADRQFEEDELCLAVESLSTDEVICPLCEKSSLVEHKGIILCACGLRIDTEQDCINLKNIKVNLQVAATEHSDQCESKPGFSLTQKFGITNILMSCQACDFLFIIV